MDKRLAVGEEKIMFAARQSVAQCEIVGKEIVNHFRGSRGGKGEAVYCP